MRKGKSPRPLIRRGFRIGLGANERAISVRRWKEESSFFYSSRSFFFLYAWKRFERTNSSRDDVYIYLRHVTLEVWSRCSGKMEEFFQKGVKKGSFVTREGTKFIWRNFGKIFLSRRGRGRDICLVHFGLKRLGGSRFRRKIERGFGKQRDKYLRALNRSLLFAAVKLGRWEGKWGGDFPSIAPFCRLPPILINDFCNEY